MPKRPSKSANSGSDAATESETLTYDPFRGSESVTLQELLPDIFSDNLEDGASLEGDHALTLESQILADEDRPLHVVARRGNTLCTKLLLDAGADPNSKGDLSLSPLYYAIRGGHFEVARLLLEAGARIDVFNEFGCTDLGLCSPNGTSPNPKMFRLLQSSWPGIPPKPKFRRRRLS